MSFMRPELLWLVIAVPAALTFALVLHARRRRRIAEAFGEPHLLVRLGGAALLRMPPARMVLIVAAGALLGFSIAGPRWGQRITRGDALAMNIVVAADISKSMLAADVSPNRLERARLFGRQLLRELPGDRFGLVVFAGRAYVMSPLTVDHSAMQLYLDALDPEMVSQGGSSLAAAVSQATDLVRGSGETGGDRAVILISDGEALEEKDAVLDAADRARRAGVRFITLGVGTTAGTTIPEIDPGTGETIGSKRDEYGEIVTSRLDEELLRDVAERTGGRYLRIDQARALETVLDEVRGMQRVRGEEMQRVEVPERFAWFAALALLLLLLDTVLHADGRRAATRTPTPLPGRDGAAGTRSPRVRDEAGTARGSRTGARSAAGAAVVALLVLNGFGIGDLERGNRLYREGRYAEAIEAYREAIADGADDARVHYNLGTALLAIGQYDEAQRHLEIALRDVEPDLRERAYYNLGNRFLLDARATDDLQRQGQLLDAALEAYRRTLRIRPDDVQAKWNLELALRDRDENAMRQQQQQQQEEQQDQEQEQDEQQQDADAGGSGSNPSQSPSTQGDRMGSSDNEPMSEAEAERILSAMEQDERELTRDRLRRGQRRAPVLRDW